VKKEQRPTILEEKAKDAYRFQYKGRKGDINYFWTVGVFVKKNW